MRSIDYSKKILKSTSYSGNSLKNQKEISASMLGSDTQQALLRYKYGVIEEYNVTQASIGSLVHLGLSKVDFGVNVHKEIKYSMHYRDWKITGTIDRIDMNNNMITDIKVSKTYTVKSILEDTMHQYRLQLNIYRMLAENAYGKEFNMQLEFYDKQGGFNYRTGSEIPHLQYIPIDKIDNEILYEKIDEIIDFVELGQEKQCDDVWIRKIGSKAVPTRCELYCSYKQVCSQYNPKPETSMIGW